jgi:hypothetical protein
MINLNYFLFFKPLFIEFLLTNALEVRIFNIFVLNFIQLHYEKNTFYFYFHVNHLYVRICSS